MAYKISNVSNRSLGENADHVPYENKNPVVRLTRNKVTRGFCMKILGLVLALLVMAQPGSAQTPQAAPGQVAPGRPIAPSPVAPGSTLNVATRIIRPFVFEENGQLTGFSIDLWRLIGQRMNLQTNFDVQPTVSDLLAAVKDGRDRTGISAISITAERERSFDFSQPMFETGLGIMAPLVASGGLMGTLQMLDWSSIAKVFGVFFILMIIPAHIIWFDHRKEVESTMYFPINRKYFPGIFEAAYWSAVSWSGQGEGSPVRWVSRMAYLMTCYGSVFFVAFFTASASSSLTLQQLKGDISGPADLPGKRVATVKGSTASDYLRKVGAKQIEANDSDAAIKALLGGEADAVVYDMPVLQYFVAQNPDSKMQVVGEAFLKGNYGIVFQPDDPLRKAVNEALLALTEDGTIANLNNKWLGAKITPGAQ